MMSSDRDSVGAHTNHRGGSHKRRLLFAPSPALVLLLLAGCGGGGSDAPPPSLSVSPGSLTLTATLGGDAVQETLSVSATGGTLSYQVSSDTDLLSISPTSGTAGAAGLDVTVELNCSAPESRSATITVTAGSNTRTVGVDIECERPTVAVEIERAPALAKGNPREAAKSDFRWRATSIWDGQGAVSYSIRSDRSDVTATPSSGEVEMDQPTEIALEVACPDQDRFDADLVLEVDGVSTDVSWDVRCQAGDVRMTRIQLFQGVMNWEWEDAADFLSLLVDRVADRQTMVAVAITHETSAIPDLRAQIIDAEGAVLEESLESIREETTKTGSQEWATERVYDVSDYYVVFNAINFFMDEDNRLDETDEGNNEQRLQFGGGKQLPPFKIVFFPIRTDAGTPPAIDTDDYMESVIDLLPIGRYEARVGRTLSFLNRTADTDTVLPFLEREWNRNAQADEYYYGIYLETHDDGFCGSAYIPGNVAVQQPLEDCSSLTTAHEIGHNLSLRHVPCPSAPDISNPDPDYPYDEGVIGPRRGWLASDDKFVGDDPDEIYYDVMSYCDTLFISDYHYKKALDYRIKGAIAHRAGEPIASVNPGGAPAEEPEERSGPSLAFGGTVEWGMWTLDYTDRSPMPARTPPVDGDYFFTLQDAFSREIYRERLRLAFITHSAKRSWAVRVPIPSQPIAKLVILDEQETPVLVPRPCQFKSRNTAID